MKSINNKNALLFFLIVIQFLIISVNINQIYDLDTQYHIDEAEEKSQSSETNKNPELATFEHIWNRTWGGGAIDWGDGMVINSLEEIYITGYTYSYAPADAILLKYNSSGNLDWAKTWGGPSVEHGNGIALDTSGNVLIAGDCMSYGAGDYDSLVVKYNSSGKQIWNKTWGGSNIDRAMNIATDNEGNAYVTGLTASFGVGSDDMFLVKYNSSGDQVWNKTWGGAMIERGYGIVFDNLTNIYITGLTGSFGAGGDDLFLVKYSTSGVQIWNKTWGSSSSDYGSVITLSDTGNIIIAGSTNSYGSGGYDIQLLMYDPSGNHQWSKTWGGSLDDRPRDIILDDNGNILITGDIYNSGTGAQDMIVVEYDSSGNYIWYNTWGGSQRDIGLGIVLDNSSNVFVSGCKDINGVGTTGNVFLVKYNFTAGIMMPSNDISNGNGNGDSTSKQFIDYLWLFIFIGIIGILGVAGALVFARTRRNKPQYGRKAQIKELKEKESKEKEAVLENKFPLIEQLIQEKQFSSAIYELEKVKKEARQYQFINILIRVEEKIILCKKLEDNLTNINKIKKTILDLGTKFPRLQTIEITEKTEIRDEKLIIDTIKDMIENKEIYAEYFESSKSIAFDQQANINEIDKLMTAYEDWEERDEEKK